MGELLPFRRPELSPEMRAHLIQRMADLSVQMTLLQSEYDQLERRVNKTTDKETEL